MQTDETNREYAKFKLSQARDALDEAKGLLADDAELKYVVNSLYYGFYYPMLALLQTKGIPAAMQSVSIAMFEKEFVQTGVVEARFRESVRKAFELKPKCAGAALSLITRDDVQTLLRDAEDFIVVVSRMTGVARSKEKS